MSEEDLCEKCIIITCSENKTLSNGLHGSIVSFYIKDNCEFLIKQKVSFIEFCNLNARKECLKHENPIVINLIKDHLKELMYNYNIYFYNSFFDNALRKNQYKNDYKERSYVRKGSLVGRMTEEEKEQYLANKKKNKKEYLRTYMKKRRELENNKSENS